MDLLDIVRKKAKGFEKTKSVTGIEATIHHIEIAEKHYENGHEGREHLFTDVIYRTNQAFEGALKEAYRLFSGKEPGRKSPNDIERYLEKDNILKPRVLSQFTTYRQEWRNKSTHDYQLFFTSQEAVLAIVSVTAFLNILLDQMQERSSFEQEKQKLGASSNAKVRLPLDYEKKDFLNQCVALINLFSEELKQETDQSSALNGNALVGRLSAFISTSDAGISIASEKQIDHASGVLHVDLLLGKGTEEIIVEVKSATQQYDRKLIRAKEQIRHYLIAAKLKAGIVYAPVLRPTAKSEYEVSYAKTVRGEVQIVSITPAIGAA